MALFKIFRGTEDQLQGVKMHDGYAYFTSDTGNLFIDVGDEDTDGKRIQVNAESAIKLHKDNKTIEIDDIVLTNAVEANKLAIGKEEGGLTALDGIGVLFTDESGIPSFGNALPIEYGGTGASTAEEARTNLDVYSKAEVDDKIDVATFKPIEQTLIASNWTGDEENGYTQTLRIANLRCGKNGDVPPIITFKTNREDYSLIDTADATPKQSIIFTCKEKPENNIEIIILDAG